jgi:hypothetical protein
MIESWIDELAKVWEISDGHFGTVHSYRLIEKAEFPESIDPVDLDKNPIALTIPATLDPEYSAGGPQIGFYTGVTEFHVSPDLNYGRLPQMLLWYGVITKAAASHAKLNGTVEIFLIETPGIVGPVALQYGSEAWHWGFTVHWRVKERLEGQITFSA